MINYASIVPLIGGETIAMQNVFGKEPDYIMSYSGFEANDSQLLNYYNNRMPYIKLDEGGTANSKVDVVNSVCPCAGLSSLSVSSNSNHEHNDWMIKSSQYVIENIQPKVLWGENAPRLASKMGEPIVNKLRKIAKDNGYTFTLYKTKSKLHGLSQVRDRAFFFFWKSKGVPVFKYYNRPHTRIEDQIRSSARNDDDPMSALIVRKEKPTANPYYQHLLEVVYGGIEHVEFVKKIKKTTNVLYDFELKGGSYIDMAKWMEKNGYDSFVPKCERMYKKLASGGNIMRKTTEIPKDYIGAFVGHLPTSLTHPDTDRYLSVRECLDIMKMPSDFQLVGGVKNLNMICQNVPVTTAQDMAENVKKFINDDIQMVSSEFAVQDNKTRSFNSEVEVNTLSEFL
jgi:site-specific DNA-cytosine methylase